MISSIIKENIKEIDIDVAKETTRNYLEDKLGILDFRVKLGNNTQWMLFINNPDSVEVKEIMRSNEEIKEALEKYDTILGDEELMAIAEQKEKRERDEINAMQNAEEKGANKSKIEIAKNMKIKKIDIKLISEITGLTKEEIEKI